jgi:hypothetical protein
MALALASFAAALSCAASPTAAATALFVCIDAGHAAATAAPYLMDAELRKALQ